MLFQAKIKEETPCPTPYRLIKSPPQIKIKFHDVKEATKAASDTGGKLPIAP